VQDVARPPPDLVPPDPAVLDPHTVRLVLVESDKLMGRAEIGQRLGVGYSRTKEIIARADFPRPLKKLTGMQIWDGEAVEAWIAEHRKPATEDDDTEV
jgi:predicted DNA-binding transcriptional regulator AlpA